MGRNRVKLAAVSLTTSLVILGAGWWCHWWYDSYENSVLLSKYDCPVSGRRRRDDYRLDYASCPEYTTAQEYCKEGHPHIEGCSCLDMMASKTAFVTGLSAGHYKEARNMLGSIQKHVPGSKIIVYNLGMTRAQLRQICLMCDVELRLFDFGRYPAHVSPDHLKWYAWKPLIMGNVTREYEIVMWADASIRLKTSLKDHAFPYLLQADLTFMGNPHVANIAQFTHDGTIKYLNLTRKDLTHIPEIESGSDIFWLTSKVRRIVDEWEKCALVKDCIAPEGADLGDWRICLSLYGGSEDTDFIGCHRFDQSALDLLIFKYHGRGVAEAVKLAVDRTLLIERADISHGFELQYC